MPTSEKEPNSTMKIQTKRKKIRVSDFSICNAYIEFQNTSIHVSKDIRGLKSVTSSKLGT